MTKLALAATVATVALATAAAVGPLNPIATAQEADPQLGNVLFVTTCSEGAQRRFDRAMRYQHSFWYRQSQELFENVLQADASCGIAWWGIALSLWNNPHGPPPPQNVAAALTAIEKAKSTGAKSERE